MRVAKVAASTSLLRLERRRSPRRGPPPNINREARVYVWNLPWSVRWQDLKDHFSSVGQVNYTKVMEDRYTGRSKGCGIVEFATREDAQKAIETMNDTTMGDRRISVREDREPGLGPPPRSGGYDDRRGGDRGGYDDRRGDDRDAPPPGDDKKDAPAEQGLNEDLDNYFANAPKDEAAPPPGGDEVPA